MLIYDKEKAADVFNMLKYIEVRWPYEETLKDDQSENENIAYIISEKNPYLIYSALCLQSCVDLQHCSV
jgi:hypothetical protein